MSKKVDLQEARAIINWMNLNEDIRELSIKSNDLELHISRNEHSRFAASAHAPAPAPVAAAPVAAPTAAAPAVVEQAPAAPAAPAAAPQKEGAYAPAADEVVIKAPMVGTFYAAPKPGAPAFVKEGDSVTPETVLCIVEVMKLMNNIEAGVEGVVQKILVSNEAPVGYNEPLMVIKLKS